MTIEDIKFLISREGNKLLNKYSVFSDRELEDMALNLAKNNIPHYSAIISTIKLRRKASHKFKTYNKMLFTKSGLEMATSEKIADYIANRIGEDKTVIDFGCGIGGNLLSLAKKNKVIAVDNDIFALELAKFNAKICSVEQNIQFIEGKIEDCLEKEADVFFFDPERQRPGKTKTRSILNGSPNIFSILSKIKTYQKDICIKISPAFDYKELALIEKDFELEIISENNENKVALLWFGSLAECERKATVFTENNFFQLKNANFKENIVVSRPKAYIYLTNKAVSKAHLVDEIAKKLGLDKIDPNSSILTSDRLIMAKDKAVVSFKFIEAGIFSLSKLRLVLDKNKIDKITIVSKISQIDVKSLEKRLKLAESNIFYAFLYLDAVNKRRYILVKKLKI